MHSVDKRNIETRNVETGNVETRNVETRNLQMILIHISVLILLSCIQNII